MPRKKTSTDEEKGRTRNWTFVLYPDSAPENWRDILDDCHIEWIESPLHEFDVNPTGEVKKAHWHILIMFGGVKTYEQAMAIADPLGVNVIKRCHNSKSLVRYMAHLDNPEKHQYPITEIRAHGGVDLDEILRPSASERYELIREIQHFCRDEKIIEFQDLMEYAAENRFDDWYPVLCDSCAYVIGNYIRSQRHRMEGSKAD